MSNQQNHERFDQIKLATLLLPKHRTKIKEHSAILKQLLFVLMVTALFLVAANSLPNDEEMNKNYDLKGKLIFAHVLYRHGDRTPVEPYPTDPYRSVKNWPTGFGQLTNTGKLQQFSLGQWLRKRYSHLLSSVYNKDEIYIQSTDVDRTLMSALANLAGLYVPTGKDVWNSQINWQPIPIHTVPENIDNILAAKAPCAAYDHELSKVVNSLEFQKLNKYYDYLYKYLTKYTGRLVNTMEIAQRINNTLFIENLYNKTLPDWTKSIYPSEDMTNLSNFVFVISTYTKKLARFKAGPIIKDILKRFDDKAKGKLQPNRNVWIYSAHDTTIVNVLNTLQLFEMHSPPYAACILIELRIDEKQQPLVSVFYKNTTLEPKPLHIPNCGVSCPLKKMFTLYDDVLPKDWYDECQLPTFMMTYEEANIGTAMGILVALISVLLLFSYVIMTYYRGRTYKNYSSYSQIMMKLRECVGTHDECIRPSDTCFMFCQ